VGQFRYFQLENFRAFKDSEKFNFPGITILTGKNSSGKSSIIKSLLLCKDNFESDRFPRILKFEGSVHGLGSLKYAKNNETAKNSKLSFSWPAYTRSEYETPIIKMLYRSDKKQPDYGFIVGLEFYDPGSDCVFGSINFVSDYKIQISFKCEILFEVLKGILNKPTLKPNQKISNRAEQFSYLKDLKDIDQLCNVKFMEDDSDDDIEEIGDNWDLKLFHDYNLWDVFELFFQKLLGDNKMRGGSILTRFMERHFTRSFSHFFQFGFKFLPSIRGHQTRLYVDNVANTVINKVAKEFYDNADAIQKSKGIQSFLKKWLSEFELGDSISVNRVEGIATSIKINNGPKSADLSDFGFGTTQFMVMLMEIVNLAIQKEKANHASPYWMISIEEPESNLHPDFQSKLADLFVDAWIQFQIQFLLETHSEYMIRKMQLLIKNNKSKKGFLHSDLEVYYINKTEKKSKKVSKVVRMCPQQDGSFKHGFGPGFYDESSNLAMDLFDL
jgi:predicted ATPase